jgi:hypothetical protein
MKATCTKAVSKKELKDWDVKYELDINFGD